MLDIIKILVAAAIAFFKSLPFQLWKMPHQSQASLQLLDGSSHIYLFICIFAGYTTGVEANLFFNSFGTKSVN